MSLLDTIKKDEQAFTGWVVKEYSKFYKAEPKIADIVDTVLKYAIPAISIVVGAEAGAPAAAVVNSVGVEAQKDLLAVSGLVYDFGPTPTAANIVAGVQSNLSNLLTDGHITNTTNVANITKVVTTLGSLVTALTPSPAPAQQQTLPVAAAPIATKEVL